MDRKDYDLLEKYLKGQLDEESRAALEQRLEEDEALAAELAWQKRMQQFLRKNQEREQLKTKLEKLGDRYFSQEEKATTAPPPRLPVYRRRSLQIAAGIAILIIAGWLTTRLLQQPSLYRQYAQHPALALTEMSGEGPDVRDIEQAFNQGDYEAAARDLQTYLQQHPADTLALLYRGISLLETGQLQEAASIFSIIRSGKSDLRGLGDWYLALTYLRQGHRSQAREVLRSIPPGADKYEEAQELMDRL
jgi:hypothetical protein